MNSQNSGTKAARNIGIVVSCGRTGTQFIAEYFARNYPDVTALHEPPPSYALRRATHAYMEGRRTEEDMARLLTCKRRALMQTVSTNTYVESNGYLHGFIPVLDRVWHRPHVIHIVRDPRTFIPSALAHQNRLKRAIVRVVPDWLPDSRKLLNIETKLCPAGEYAAFWRAVNESIERTATNVERYHFLRFEDLFGETYEGLRRICEILSLEFMESGAAVRPDHRINASRTTRMKHWTEWPSKLCADVHEICGAAMTRYGYGDEEDWIERVQAGRRERATGIGFRRRE